MLALVVLLAVIAGFVYVAVKASDARRLFDQGVEPRDVSNGITRSFLEARLRQEGMLPATSSNSSRSASTAAGAFLGLTVGACASYLFAPTTIFGKPSFTQWVTEGYQVGQFRSTILICAVLGALIGGMLSRMAGK